LEKLKTDIGELKETIMSTNMASERTRLAVQAIREALIEMLLKLQEIDECVEHQTKRKVSQPTVELPDIIDGVISTADLLELLESKIKFGMIASGHRATGDMDSGVEDDDEGAKVESVFSLYFNFLIFSLIFKFDAPAPSSVNSSEEEEKGKPPIFPAVYANLVTGRATVLTSPGQINQASKSTLTRKLIPKWLFQYFAFSCF
jgi:coiled-coil domain-containing protein 151